MKKRRCKWVNESIDLYIDYHDHEWGIPVYDDRLLFEMLILEGAQAGLTWSTILKKRKHYKLAYDNFDPNIVSQYDDAKKQELLNNENIIRNKLKINASINNAKFFIDIQKEFGSFSKYIWKFTNNKIIKNKWKFLEEIPTYSNESVSMSKALKKRGFKFVGPTICYAFMQAIGMVNDHTTYCFKY